MHAAARETFPISKTLYDLELALRQEIHRQAQELG